MPVTSRLCVENVVCVSRPNFPSHTYFYFFFCYLSCLWCRAQGPWMTSSFVFVVQFSNEIKSNGSFSEYRMRSYWSNEEWPFPFAFSSCRQWKECAEQNSMTWTCISRWIISSGLTMLKEEKIRCGCRGRWTSPHVHDNQLFFFLSHFPSGYFFLFLQQDPIIIPELFFMCVWRVYALDWLIIVARWTSSPSPESIFYIILPAHHSWRPCRRQLWSIER